MKKVVTILFIVILNSFCNAQNVFPGSGNVGIGTTTPTNVLKVLTSTPGSYDGISIQQTSSTGIGLLGVANNDGSDVTVFVGSTGQTARNFYGLGVGKVADITSNGFNALAIGTFNVAPLILGTNHNENLRIDVSGNVGIGTSNPDTKLAVNGTIHAKEVKVDLNGWSDYVFEPKYILPTLTSVKNHIDKNHRLPQMPSTQDVIENGVNLGEIMNLQMKKIEELTLYLIKQNAILEKQQKINKSLQLQIDNLLKK